MLQQPIPNHLHHCGRRAGWPASVSNHTIWHRRHHLAWAREHLCCSLIKIDSRWAEMMAADDVRDVKETLCSSQIKMRLWWWFYSVNVNWCVFCQYLWMVQWHAQTTWSTNNPVIMFLHDKHRTNLIFIRGWCCNLSLSHRKFLLWLTHHCCWFVVSAHCLRRGNHPCMLPLKCPTFIISYYCSVNLSL